MKVKYWWSAGGEGELCDFSRVVLGREEFCSHCGRLMGLNAHCVQLVAPDGDIYLLHEDCARDGIGWSENNLCFLRYRPEDFSEPLREDMQSVYSAYELYAQSKTDDVFWSLKNAVWQLSLTLKAYRATGELSAALCDEVNDWAWGLLLEDCEQPSNNVEY